MRYLTWLVAGLIGGLIGAVVWAAVVYLTDYELGIIAWAIGVLSGLGVRAVAGDTKGAGPAAVASTHRRRHSVRCGIVQVIGWSTY